MVASGTADVVGNAEQSLALNTCSWYPKKTLAQRKLFAF